MTSNSALFPRPIGGIRGLAAVAALLAVATVGLALAPARASAAPRYFVGLQGWDDPTLSQLVKVRGAGIQTYRIQLSWASVEKRRPSGACRGGGTTCKRYYNWDRYDRLILGAAKKGVRLLPVLLGSPRWAYSKQTTPPLGPVGRRSFYDFTREATKRYGPNGTIWRGRGVSRNLRAHDFQVWNEPNLPNYWKGKPNPGQYAAFLSGAYDAAKRGDRDVRIVVGGLPYSTIRGTIDPPEFLRGMVRANPGIYRKFHSVGLHPYALTPGDMLKRGVRPMRVAMNKLGKMRGKYIHITEFGWATGRPDGRFQVSESTQARYLRDALNGFIGARHRYNIRGAIWFSLIDKRDPSFWGERTGLFRSNGSHKPSWTALNRVTGAG